MGSQKALAAAALLTALHFFAKLVGGYLTNSLALISDAWHLLTDLLSLVLSWWAIKVANKKPKPWATFGFHRAGILAALANNISLIAVSFYILYEAYLRLLVPREVETWGMTVLSALGVVISALIVYMTNQGAKKNLNVKSVWLHFAGETLASLGVLLGGIVIYFTGWFWIDTALSAFLGLVILRSSCVMLKDIVIILLNGIPGDLDVDDISKCLKQIPQVQGARDIHVWYLAEEVVIMSVHIQVEYDLRLSQTEPILAEIKGIASDKFNITHVVVQLERNGCNHCLNV